VLPGGGATDLCSPVMRSWRSLALPRRSNVNQMMVAGGRLPGQGKSSAANIILAIMKLPPFVGVKLGAFQ